MGLLENKVALITGCRGICQATELVFAREGADVALTWLRDIAPAKENLEKVRSMGRRAIAVEVDVRRVEDVRRMVRETLDEFGRIDILVNCAGVYTYVPAEEATEEQYDRDVDTNLKGTFFSCVEVAKAAMIPRRRGRIVNIASLAGILPQTKLGPYSVAKAGIIHMTKNLAMEWAKYGIAVNCVSPGFVATKPLLEAIGRGDVDGDAVTRACPMNRLAQPEEVAEAIAWMASDRCTYMTAANLLVDGGYTAGLRFTSLREGRILVW